MKLLLFFSLIGLFVYWITGLFSPSASAQTMSNDNYILQLQELDVSMSKPTIKNRTLGVSDQQASEQKPEPNYKIQAGFVDDKSKSPFTFSVSETLIDFSTLSPTNPIKRSNKLAVSNGSANGYSVIASEDRELSSSPTSNVASASSGFILDTTCDNGLCSEARSALWTNPLTYGFGYRCENIVGTDCASGFSEVEFYKQFANASKSKKPQKVASATNTGKNKTVQITYKVNVSGTQQFAFYSNTITYIAVPNF